MVQECLSNNTGIQIFQRTGIAVELLPGRDTLCRDIGSLAFVVFPNALMGFVVVIILDEQCPPVSGFLQGLYLLGAAFADIAVDQAVIDLNFSFTLARIRLCPKVPDPKP